MTLAALISRATTSLILGGDGSEVSFWRLRCRAARFKGRSSLTSLLDGSVGQSGTAALDLGGGGERGGAGDRDRLELIFLPRSIADFPRIGSWEDPDLPLPGLAFFPGARRAEVDCKGVTACVPLP